MIRRVGPLGLHAVYPNVTRAPDVLVAGVAASAQAGNATTNVSAAAINVGPLGGIRTSR
jgi:hypothetical protein